MPNIQTVKRVANRLSNKQRSCTKHGPYDGPYCATCYKQIFGEGQDAMPETRDS